MRPHCMRCGAPARAIDDVSHVFCDACVAMASTGARSSSELLFTTKRGDEGRVSTRSERASLERVSFPVPGSIAMPVPSVKPPPRSIRRFFFTVSSYVALAASVAFFTGSAVLAKETHEREQRILSFAEGAIVVEETITPEPIAPSASATEPSAPPTVSTVVEQPTIEEPVIETPRPRRARPARAPIAALPATEPEAPLEEILSRPMLPSRGDVRSALARLQGNVAQCSDGTNGTAQARVTFLGNGRVASADVTSAEASPAVKSCIARAVRGAEVPPFAQERFTVVFPYRF